MLDLPAVAKVEKEPYTTEEARQLIKAIEGHRFEALFATSLTTGLREGEILGLRWADVDLEQGIITVNATLHRRDGSWHWESPKSEESKRVVALIPYTLGLLAKHRESQSAERLVVGEYHPTNNPKGWIRAKKADIPRPSTCYRQPAIRYWRIDGRCIEDIRTLAIFDNRRLL